MVCIQQSACQHERNERQSKAPGGKAAAALFPQQTGDGKHGSQPGGSHAERQAAAQHGDISGGKRAAAVAEPDAQQGGSQQRQHDDGQEKGRQARALFLSCGTVIALLYGSILHKTRSFREVLFCIISQEAAEGQYRYKKIAEEKASLLLRRSMRQQPQPPQPQLLLAALAQPPLFPQQQNSRSRMMIHQQLPPKQLELQFIVRNLPFGF